MRRVSYATLAEHPHRDELHAAMARIPALTDDELRTLAGLWVNTPTVAKARAKALNPDTLLVVDILRVFDDVAQLFADDLDSIGAHVHLDPATVSKALKAVRDGLAGIIARPVLSRREAHALETPWRSALARPPAITATTAGTPTDGTPTAVTPTAAVDGFLATVRRLNHRCHDSSQAEAFDRILVGAMCRDRADHTQALDTAFQAALGTQRHRVWSLVRVTTERGLSDRCRTCPPSAGFDDYDRERVIALCADAACALLVADIVPARTLDVLLEPLSGLVPFPRLGA